MQTNDSDQVPPPAMPPPPPGPSSAGGFQNPADYYQQPPASTPDRKGCWKWALGCGGAGCLVLIMGFAGIFVFSSQVIGWFFGQLEKTVAEAAAPNVPEEERDALREELTTLRRNIREKRVDLQRIQPLMGQIQGAISDQELTREEVQDLTEEIRGINEDAGGRETDETNL